MVSAGDFRNGITVEIEGNVFQIVLCYRSCHT